MNGNPVAQYDSLSEASRVLGFEAKGPGDISGVSDPFLEVRESVLDGRRITEKGRDGRVFLVLWTDGAFSYSFHTPLGANPEAIRLLIESVTAAD